VCVTDKTKGLYSVTALGCSVANIFVRSVSWCLFIRDCVQLGTVRQKKN